MFYDAPQCGRLSKSTEGAKKAKEVYFMRSITVMNQKGGCGKTITSINLSAFLAREQRKVLLVDMDPQGHATLGLLAEVVQSSKTMYKVFLREAGGDPPGLRDAIRPVRENLDVAPADILLSAV